MRERFQKKCKKNELKLCFGRHFLFIKVLLTKVVVNFLKLFVRRGVSLSPIGASIFLLGFFSSTQYMSLC